MTGPHHSPGHHGDAVDPDLAQGGAGLPTSGITALRRMHSMVAGSQGTLSEPPDLASAYGSRNARVPDRAALASHT